MRSTLVPVTRHSPRSPLSAALAAAALLLMSAVSADALACKPFAVERPTTTVRPVSTDVAARIAALESQASLASQQAEEHASRAAAIRAAAEELREVVPASFGEARDVMLARVDALEDRAAIEVGEARAQRVRASELRVTAARLRQSLSGDGGSGGGWRRRNGTPPRPVADVARPLDV